MLNGYKTYVVGALAVVGALGGCAALPGDGQAQTAIVDAEKALTLCHLAYQGAGVALKNAAGSGALHGADAARAKALYDQAGAALDAADAADAVADAPGALAALARANALIAQLHTLIPQN
jgi:hypothetical protein